MKGKRFIVSFVLCTLSLCTFAQQAQNRPYVDDKLFHFGFQLGINFATFQVTDLDEPITNFGTGQPDTLHARVSTLMPGFHVGFVTDLRLCRYLNLRFCPGMLFTNRTLHYQWASGSPVSGSAGKYGANLDVLAIPIYLPFYLKWSAEREGNYRPYVIAGGGISCNVSRDHEKPVLLNTLDYFCEVGFGVDLYFTWFKLCPEITYRIGFADQLTPNSARGQEVMPQDVFYTDGIKRMTTHCICLTFNFE